MNRQETIEFARDIHEMFRPVLSDIEHLSRHCDIELTNAAWSVADAAKSLHEFLGIMEDM